jgi:small subunit ribosomal protein S6
MMKRYYETLMLLPVEVAATDLSNIEKQFATYAQDAGGSVALFEKWGRYRLAYPVRKQEYGVYVLVRYELADVDGFFKKLETFLRVKCVETVMRYTHVVLTEKAFSAPYVKPDSMEVAAAKSELRESRGPRRFSDRNADRNAGDKAVEKKEEAPAVEADAEAVSA